MRTIVRQAQRLIFAAVLLAPVLAHAGQDPDIFAKKAADNAAGAISDVTPNAWLTESVTTGVPSAEPYLLRCTAQPNKMIVYVHTWSGDYTQVQSYPALTTLDHVCLVSPNFGGPNNTPQALASTEALARMMAVINEAKYKTNLTRIYLIAASGGTIQTLDFMAAYPGVVHRASLWLVGWDLASIYTETADPSLPADMLSVFGHAPSGPLDPDYWARSPRSRGAMLMSGYPAVFFNYGTSDTTLPPHNTTDAYNAAFIACGTCTLRLISWPIGHVFGADQMDQAIHQILFGIDGDPATADP